MMPAPASNVPNAPLAGFRNRLRNASFAINQRAVSGTVTLAAGAYGHDGVKGGASGCTYTFAASSLDTTLTITAGSLILPIESALIEGGAYMLGQAGTSQARVWQGTGSTGSGSFVGVPVAVTGLTAATQTNVEFATGTVLRPQFEAGVTTTAFERRPPGVELSLCQRYYFQPAASGNYIDFWNYPTGAGGAVIGSIFFPPQRATPTITILGSPSYGSNTSALTASFGSPTHYVMSVTYSGAGTGSVAFNYSVSTELT